ncbi:hypothetical protein FACS1894125_3710 [Actinomycetota bacterium]|nr:hypothetical protein FACS1894125_3710 [Actinomycetota bacterium]
MTQHNNRHKAQLAKRVAEQKPALRKYLLPLLGVALGLLIGFTPVFGNWVSRYGVGDMTFTTGGLSGSVIEADRQAVLYNSTNLSSLGAPVKTYTNADWAVVNVPSGYTDASGQPVASDAVDAQPEGQTLRVFIPVKAKLQGDTIKAQMIFTKTMLDDLAPELTHDFDGESIQSGQSFQLFQTASKNASVNSANFATAIADGVADGTTAVEVANDDVVTLVITIVRDADVHFDGAISNDSTTVSAHVAGLAPPAQTSRDGYTFIGYKGCHTPTAANVQPGETAGVEVCYLYDVNGTPGAAADTYKWDSTNKKPILGTDGRTDASIISADVVLTAVWVE